MEIDQTTGERRTPTERRVSVPYAGGELTMDPGRNRISWAAVFAGSVLAGVISLALYLLGLGIGAATVNPQEEAQPFSGLGLGSAIWTVVATLVALFIGGWAAGRVSPSVRRIEGVLHGLITWGFVTLLMVYLVGSAATGLVGGAFNMVSSGLPAAAQQAGPGDTERLQREAGGTVERLRQQAPAIGQQAANMVSRASIVSAIAILLGGLAAGFGGAVGAGGRRHSTHRVTGANAAS